MKVAVIATHGVIPQAQYGFQDQVAKEMLAALNQWTKKHATKGSMPNAWQMSVVFPTVSPPRPRDPLLARKPHIVRIYGADDKPENPQSHFFDVHEAYWSPVDKGRTTAASVVAWLVRTIFLPFNDVARFMASPEKVAWDVGFIISAIGAGAALFGIALGAFAWSLGAFKALARGTPVIKADGPLYGIVPFLHADYFGALQYLTNPSLLFSATSVPLAFGVIGAYLAAQAAHAISSIIMNWKELTRDSIQVRSRIVAVALLSSISAGSLLICAFSKIGPHHVAPGGIAIALAFAFFALKGGQGLGLWFIANFFGDVQIYTTRDNNSTFFILREAILGIVTQTILDVIQTPPDHPNYDRVYVFAHSLGSTISLDALLRIYNMQLENLVDPAQYKKIRGFVTFGTALEKTKYFFDVWSPTFSQQYDEWRNDVYGSLFTAERAALYGPNHSGIYWQNCWYFTDFVGNKIESYRSIVPANARPSSATWIRKYLKDNCHGHLHVGRVVAENRKLPGSFAPWKAHFVTHGDYLGDSLFWNADSIASEFGALEIILSELAPFDTLPQGAVPARTPRELCDGVERVDERRDGLARFTRDIV